MMAKYSGEEEFGIDDGVYVAKFILYLKYKWVVRSEVSLVFKLIMQC